MKDFKVVKNNNELRIVSSEKIYEVLDLVRRKPTIWLTSKSITSLHDFLNGYMLLGFGNNICHSGEPTIDDFKYWMLNKHTRSLGVGHPYSTILLLECNGDEENAFDRFFEYLKEFLEQNQD